jgi:hypothetical protein
VRRRHDLNYVVTGLSRAATRHLYLSTVIDDILLSRLSWKWRERSSVKINGEDACEKSESTTPEKRR